MSQEPFHAFSPVVHPDAWVHPSAQLLGEVQLDEGASVWPTSVLRGDCGRVHVGARTNVQDGTVAHATRGVSTTSVGVECTIGHRVILHGCAVGDHCLIGMGSTLLDTCDIGAWSFVAAGALVPPGKRFEPRSFIIGAPAKRLREVSAKDLEMIDHAWKVYVDLVKGYRGR